MKQRPLYYTPLRQNATIHETKKQYTETRNPLQLPNIFQFKQPNGNNNFFNPVPKNHIRNNQQYQINNISYQNQNQRRFKLEAINKTQLEDSVETIPISIKKTAEIIDNLSYKVRTQTGFMAQKLQKVNQDSYLIHLDTEYKIFAIYDGHGENGHFVSQFLRNNLIKNLPSQQGNINEISQVYKNLNDQLLMSSIDTRLSGSTGVSVHLGKNTLFCANVGDSRAILGRKTNNRYIPIKLNSEHKPTGKEKERIIKAGGRIDFARDALGRPKSPLRVWLSDVDVPGLAMTRCFGDKIGVLAGIIGEPEILEFNLQNEDHFIVVGSDGFFDHYEDADICNLISKYYPLQIDKAADQLLFESMKKWKIVQQGRDDISFILIFRFSQ